jgi:hypothetical protein
MTGGNGGPTTGGRGDNDHTSQENVGHAITLMTGDFDRRKACIMVVRVDFSPFQFGGGAFQGSTSNYELSRPNFHQLPG